MGEPAVRRAPIYALATAAALCGGVLVTTTPAQAADDWYKVDNWTITAHKADSDWSEALRYPRTATQAQGRGLVRWSNGSEANGYVTEVQTAANDVVRDGYCALVEVYYQKKIGGVWKDQLRVNSADCVDRDGKAYWGSIQHSRTPIRHVKFRTCLGGEDWKVSLPRQCSSWDT